MPRRASVPVKRRTRVLEGDEGLKNPVVAPGVVVGFRGELAGKSPEAGEKRALVDTET